MTGNKYVFPYYAVERGKRVVIAGAGMVGSSFIDQVLETGYCEIIGVIDKAYEEKGSIRGIKVSPYEMLKTMSYDHIVVAATPRWWMEILNDLSCAGGTLEKCILDLRMDNNDTTESVIIREIFKILRMEKIRYIDVGACHPHRSSNTMSFYINGSRGINIEPQEFLKTEFELYRPEDINLFVGIGAEPGEAIFYVSENPYLSTFSVNGKKYSEEYHNASYQESKVVKIVTLNDVVDKYCDGNFPELLDIDIEGLDEQVLEKVDFSKSSPLVICAEGSTARLNKILENKECEAGGYSPYCRIEANTIYIRNDIYKKVLCIG